MKQIIVRLDVMLALRKMRSKELAERIGITEANLSLLRTGKVKGVRFDTLAKLCDVLDCTPGDLLDIEDVFTPDHHFLQAPPAPESP
jgi:putative transcriptional regulator